MGRYSPASQAVPSGEGHARQVQGGAGVSEFIYILCWEYSDKSAFGVERAYNDKCRCDQDLALVNHADGWRHWFVLEVPLYLSGAGYE